MSQLIACFQRLAAADNRSPRVAELMASYQRAIYLRTDRWFARLLLFQWLAAVGLAFWLSPLAWEGTYSRTHEHVWTAFFLAGGIISLPLALIHWRRGQAITRHTIAVAQMLMGAYFIHLTGGRIETHFHVFGSLAFLAFYRDWRVLVTASAIVAVDHLLRGIFWPMSVFGTTLASNWRWLEHAGWVIFEDIFLIRSCAQGTHEMREIAEKQASQEESQTSVEKLAEEALAANLIKDQFLANMSHELRTPLNAIIGYSEMLQVVCTRKGQTDNLADLSKISQSGKHLLALINDVLDLSKVEAGKMQLSPERFDLKQLLQETASTVQPLALKNANKLTVDTDDNLGMMYADPTRLRQCLLNLLSNACKFTSNGTVALTVKREINGGPSLQPFSLGEGPDWVRFQIEDSGIGIAPEQMGRLFEAFSQADASTTRKFGGTGLGLSITKKLSEMMGGQVTCASIPDQGSVFTLRLPIQISG